MLNRAMAYHSSSWRAKVRDPRLAAEDSQPSSGDSSSPRKAWVAGLRPPQLGTDLPVRSLGYSVRT
jgi:hypothetical protein